MLLRGPSPKEAFMVGHCLVILSEVYKFLPGESPRYGHTYPWKTTILNRNSVSSDWGILCRV